MATLLVSDIHLTPARPEIVRLFRRFLQGRVHGADALYILGDLFEYWAGDDDLDERFNAGIAQDLASCSEGGVPIYFMRGNRDFLVGERFARESEARVLQDPSLVELYGRRTLLSHGDDLCTDDAAYQAFRRKVRSPGWIESFLARPLAERKREIESLRALSEAEKRSKPAAIMDVNALAVEALLRRHGYPMLIHGHTHRPDRHEHRVDGNRCERWVLADWYESGSCLVADPRGVRRETIL
jgi:UDP-2,3-diacylglucosamine hydrolase